MNLFSKRQSNADDNQGLFDGFVEDTLLRYDHIILHCAATRASQDIDAADIDRMHRNRGFNRGNGYQVFIKRDGEIQMHHLGHTCRPLTQSGAHVGDCGPGWNTRSLGVCYAGGVDARGVPTDNRSPEQIEAQIRVIRDFYSAHPRPWTLKVMGHRDLIRQTGAPPKACPSFDVEKFLDKYDVLEDFDFQGDMEDLEGQNTALHIPDTHLVVAGDSYWSIAERYGINLLTLRSLNVGAARSLRIGTEVRLK